MSGGNSPNPLFQELAVRGVTWDRVHIFQVDERLAPNGSGARNATQLQDVLLGPRSVLTKAPLGRRAGAASAARDDQRIDYMRIRGILALAKVRRSATIVPCRSYS